MRILCLIGQLGNGGSEKQLFLFLKHLDRTKYEPTVVVSSYINEHWRGRFEQELAVPLVTLGGMPSLLKLAKFRWLVVRQRPDLIYSWSFFTNAFLAASGKTRFIGSHRGGIEEERAGMSQRRFRMCLAPPVIVVNSSLLADELRGEGFSDERIAVIHNIFEPLAANVAGEALAETRKTVRARFGIADDEILVMGAGRNSVGKNFPFWVDVFDKAAQSVPSLRGLLLGSGGPAMRGEIVRRGLESRIQTPGEIAEGRTLLAAADVFFLSSTREGMPNVLLEAVDAGCAVLSTDAGGVKEILGADHDCPAGFVVKRGNTQAAVKRLETLAADPALRRGMAAVARNRLALFSPEAIAPRYQLLLERGSAAVKFLQLAGGQGGRVQGSGFKVQGSGFRCLNGLLLRFVAYFRKFKVNSRWRSVNSCGHHSPLTIHYSQAA